MFPFESDGSEHPDRLAEQGKGAAQRFREADLSLNKLWTYYYGIGGDIDEMSLDAYLHDALDIPPAQAGLVATAMTEITDSDRP
jgi:hypothetical protein